jgi:hypothetical protein
VINMIRKQTDANTNMNIEATATPRLPRWRGRILSAAMAGMLALFSVVLGGQATSWADQSAAPIVAPCGQIAEGSATASSRSVPSAPSAAQPTVDQTYASRESQAKGLEQFKGGDIVIVGAGGLIVVLLIILILVTI